MFEIIENLKAPWPWYLAGAVIGLVVVDVRVENIATTRKTLPDFPGLWSSLLQ